MVFLIIFHEVLIEVTKFWKIRRCLDVSDIIYANEHAEYAKHVDLLIVPYM